MSKPYTCDACDEAFDERSAPRIREVESTEFWGATEIVSKHYLACPFCGSDQLTEDN